MIYSFRRTFLPFSVNAKPVRWTGKIWCRAGFWAALAVSVLVPPAQGAVREVSITLGPGWNAVYLPVAPQGTADDVFADWPVFSVSAYSAQTLLSTRSTAGGVTGETVAPAPFLIWLREAPESSTLSRLAADSVLVCCNTGKTAYTARVLGEPAAPRIAWHLSDGKNETLNFVGVGLNAGAKVSASAYFSGCPALQGGGFYRLSGTTEGAYAVRPLAGLSATASAVLTDGMAVLAAGAAVSDWSGPLYIQPRLGVDFGRDRTEDELAIRNDGTEEKDVELALLPSADGEKPFSLLVRDAGAALVDPDWRSLSVQGETLAKKLATGETWRVALALDRTVLPGSGEALGALLRVRETAGTQMQAFVPVSALDIKESSAWPSGLWAIDIELDKVTRFVTDAERVDGLKAGGAMRLRIYVHVAADGSMRLLQRVTVAGTKKADGTISRTAYGPAADLPDGLDYARRLSSAALPVDLGALTPNAGAKWGGRISFAYKIAADSPSNPFRHPLHPMFDGKDANFEPLPCTGDDFKNYANAVKPELFSLGGEIVLDWEGRPGTVWSPQETTAGACEWVYTGLMRQGPVKASGRFTAQRVAPAVPLVLQ